MKRPQLRPRLKAIAHMIAPCNCMADIGTDHGYLPVWLCLEDRCKTAIAADINPSPLARAEETVRRFGMLDRISLRLGGGAEPLSPGEADTIVIAGMGGDNIVSILEAAPWTRNGVVLLLQPMSKAEVLRAWLPGNGYSVTAEQLVADKGVIYPILTVVGGQMEPANEAQTWGGFLLQKDALWGRYLDDRLLRLHRAASGLEKARGAEMREKRESLLAVIKTLEEWKGEWRNANNCP